MKSIKPTTVLLTLFLLLLATTSGYASVIGQWSGSSRTWNDSEFTTLLATMTGAGHTVTADEAITAGNLAAADVFLIGEPGSAPSAGELTDLSNFVNGGGILLLLADSGNTGLPALNQIAAGIGSSLAWGGSAASNPALSGGNFATEGPPYNIVGQTLDISPGTAVMAGGTALAGDYLHFEQLGAGYVFGFADRSDHNTFNPTNATVNGQLFLNIVNGPGRQVPEASSLLLLGVGLAGFVLRVRKSNQ